MVVIIVVVAVMLVGIHLCLTYFFLQGGFMLEPVLPGAFYHPGMGGSIGWGDRQMGFGMGYVTNALDVGGNPLDDVRRFVI